MDTLGSLSAILDANERNRAVKRLFSLSTIPFDISAETELAIVALVNLTERLENIEDVFCKESAKIKLLDDAFIKRNINTYQYRHSHNVKFPDYRARGALRLTTNNPQFPKERFHHSFGYAHNAADINYSTFLCAEFVYKNELLCIGSALVNEHIEIQNLLINLGLPSKVIKLIIIQLQSVPDEQTILNLTGNYLPQVRFPFVDEDYLSITPVISNEMQSKIHQYCTNNFNSSHVFNVERSANVGSLAASTGGKIKLFKSLPKALNSPHTRQDVFWKKNELLNVLIKYQSMSNALMTSNEKALLKNEYFKSLVNNLKYWKIRNIKGKNELNVDGLTQLLNLDLSRHKELSKFSYEPKYSKLFKRVIQHIINNEDKVDNLIEISDCNESFIVIPNLRVNDANAMSTSCTVGIPSLIGIWGFIHKFERNINQLNNSKIKFDSFALCIHHFGLSKRTPSKELYLRDKQKVLAPGLIDSVECDLSISLVLRVTSEEKFDSSTLQNALPTHLCGGSVHLNLKDLPNLTHVKNFDDSTKLIGTHHGKWLVPQVYDKGLLSEFLEGFKVEKFVLVNTGYIFLEKPNFKQGVLGDLKHTFAESLLNYACLVKYTLNQSHTKLFWSYKFSEQGVFLTS